jgi:hypothetical protein
VICTMFLDTLMPAAAHAYDLSSPKDLPVTHVPEM